MLLWFLDDSTLEWKSMYSVHKFNSLVTNVDLQVTAKIVYVKELSLEQLISMFWSSGDVFPSSRVHDHILYKVCPWIWA